jgi:DNA-binding transcriptional ArsR family regulator
MSLDKIFEALASAPRRQILAYLSEAELTTTQLAERFSMSAPAISRHLSAYFSDRGRPNQSDRGRCFSVIVDGLGRRTSPGLNVAQSSTISLKRPAWALASWAFLG